MQDRSLWQPVPSALRLHSISTRFLHPPVHLKRSPLPPTLCPHAVPPSVPRTPQKCRRKPHSNFKTPDLRVPQKPECHKTHFISTPSLSHFLLPFPHQQNGEHMHAFPPQRPAESSHLTTWQGPCSWASWASWARLAPGSAPSPARALSAPSSQGSASCLFQGYVSHHLASPSSSSPSIPPHYLAKEGTTKVVIIVSYNSMSFKSIY